MLSLSFSLSRARARNDGTSQRTERGAEHGLNLAAHETETTLTSSLHFSHCEAGRPSFPLHFASLDDRCGEVISRTARISRIAIVKDISTCVNILAMLPR
jgi:hypothetical protein